MKVYKLVLLRFVTPVHFGDGADGGGLGDMTGTCRADTFFSALCREAADVSESAIDWLAKAADEGEFLLSDLLPWHDPGDGAYELYLPVPKSPGLGIRKKEAAVSFDEEKERAAKRKRNKKRTFLRASRIASFLAGEADDEPALELGEGELRTSFNSRTDTPYDVGVFHFYPRTGLYVILHGEEEDVERAEKLITLAGLSGIGGRRSSGLGKFVLEDDPCELMEGGVYGGDDAALFAMLMDNASPCQMTLSSLLPAKEEVALAAEGSGLWTRRSGFTFSRQMASPVKMNSLYMMAAGACFSKRLAGRIGDVNNGMAPHPVYKYGKGLYVGLPL